MKKLKRYMQDKDLTQIQMAEKLGISQPTLNGWLTGEGRPRIDRLKRISKVTGISVEDLVKEAVAG